MQQVRPDQPSAFGQVPRSEGVGGEGPVHVVLARVHRRVGSGVDYDFRFPLPGDLEDALAVANIELRMAEREELDFGASPSGALRFQCQPGPKRP